MLNDVIDLMVILNIGLCIIIIVWDIYFYYRVPESERWTKILYTSVGILWLIRYVLYFLNIKPFGYTQSNPFLLILVTVTLLSLAVASIVRVHRLITVEDMKNDITNCLLRNTKWMLKK